MSKKSSQEDVLNEEQQAKNQATQEEQDMNAEENQSEDLSAELTKEEEQQDEIELLKRQIEEVNDKYLRLYSDFENFRRRTSKERIELFQSAGSDLIKELLPVMDDFDRAINSNKEIMEADAIKEGFELIQNKMRNILTQKGLKPMNTEVGADFDTDKHEAITNIPAPKPELKGKVVDIVEKGYMFNEKVIRYAKVVVGQ
ncbi:MAG: nucleotide exchange factor GrpE [Luteibaculum sp.]